MFSLGAWTVVLRLGLGEDTSTSTFGESLASWITLVGMVMVYVGYSFGMSQVIKATLDVLLKDTLQYLLSISQCFPC